MLRYDAPGSAPTIMSTRHYFSGNTAARFLAIALVFSVAHAALADDSAMQADAKRAAQSVDTAARQIGQDAKEAGKDVADTVKKAAKDVADASKKVGKEVADSATKAGSEVKEAAKSGVTATKQDGAKDKPRDPNSIPGSKKTDSP
jgi:gas vesicle protein